MLRSDFLMELYSELREVPVGIQSELINALDNILTHKLEVNPYAQLSDFVQSGNVSE